MEATILTLTSGIFVGIALGLTGSGGSLFAIPLLLFIVGMEMADAVPISMLVVGATALLGAISAIRSKLLLIRPTLVFGIAGMFTVPFGLTLGEIAPESLRIFSFAALAIVIAFSMAWQSLSSQTTRVVRAGLELNGSSGVCRFAPDGQMRFSIPCAVALLIAGSAVGVLSGFFGVGGGFLIVPALIYVIRMDMAYAVGSSLAIIAIISLTGGAIAGFPILIAQPSAMLFGMGSLLGMFLGRAVSNKLAGPLLHRVFSTALLITGIAMIAQLIGGSHAV